MLVTWHGGSPKIVLGILTEASAEFHGAGEPSQSELVAEQISGLEQAVLHRWGVHVVGATLRDRAGLARNTELTHRKHRVVRLLTGKMRFDALDGARAAPRRRLRLLLGAQAPKSGAKCLHADTFGAR